MKCNYYDWVQKHNHCVELVERICELNTKYDISKCSSATAVMNFSMQDIEHYFESGQHTPAELCFLIRNIDVIITSILDLNHELLGVGLNRQSNAIEKCFKNKKIISDFRTLRSLILAHPVDTNYINDDGKQEIVYLEDILLPRSLPHLSEKCDYVLRMCYPNTEFSHFKLLKVDKDIIPVINEITTGISIFSQKLQESISQYESVLKSEPLNINYDNIESYVISLDKELEKRYPSCVNNNKYADGSTRHYSIVFNCLLYIKATFREQTQKKYNIFLQYIKDELKHIESDLQSMTYDIDENSYFILCHNQDFANNESYAKEKMSYLRDSDKKSFTLDEIPNTTNSDALWGIQQFKVLIPYIKKYIPVDTTVTDKELYCEYVAANYFSNIQKGVKE